MMTVPGRARSDRAGRLDAVQSRHPDVHQDDVGPQPPRLGDRRRRRRPPRRPPPGPARRQQDPEAGSDQLLVIGQQNPDRHRCPNGSTVWTANPPSGKGPVSNLPLKTATRSRIPPALPRHPAGGMERTAALGLDSTSSAESLTCSFTRAGTPRNGERRWTAPPARSGRRTPPRPRALRSGSPSIAYDTGKPASCTRCTRPGRSSSRGCGARSPGHPPAIGPDHPEQRGASRPAPSARRPPPPHRLTGPVGVGGGQGLGGLRLYHHHRHAVGDHIMELASNPGALPLGRLPGNIGGPGLHLRGTVLDQLGPVMPSRRDPTGHPGGDQHHHRLDKLRGGTAARNCTAANTAAGRWTPPARPPPTGSRDGRRPSTWPPGRPSKNRARRPTAPSRAN